MDDYNIQFQKSIEKATSEILKKVAKNMEKSCLLVEAEAKRNCPVDEGYLRAKITSNVKVTDKSIIGYVGAPVDYAPYVEMGTGIYAINGNGRKTPWRWYGRTAKWKGWHYTKGQKPKQFLSKALNENREKIENIMKG